MLNIPTTTVCFPLFSELVADIVKNVRVATTSIFESLILCSETQNKFGPPVSEQYDH